MQLPFELSFTFAFLKRPIWATVIFLALAHAITLSSSFAVAESNCSMLFEKTNQRIGSYLMSFFRKDISEYFQDTLKMRKVLRNGKVLTLIEGPNVHILGEMATSPYSISGPRGYSNQYIDGIGSMRDINEIQYLIYGRQLSRTFDGQIDYRKTKRLPPAQLQALLAKIPGNNGDLWPLVLKEPEWAARYHIFADRDILIVPTLTSLNIILDSLSQTPHAVGPRFREVFTLNELGQQYSSKSFFENFILGEILMATKGRFGFHDQLNEHLSAALRIPPAMFEKLRSQAQLVDRLINDPVLGQEFKSLLEESRDAFARYWDDITAELGRATGPFNREGQVKADRRRETVYRLLSNERLTPEEVSLFLGRNRDGRNVAETRDEYIFVTARLRRAIQNLPQEKQKLLSERLDAIASTFDGPQ